MDLQMFVLARRDVLAQTRSAEKGADPNVVTEEHRQAEMGNHCRRTIL